MTAASSRPLSSTALAAEPSPPRRRRRRRRAEQLLLAAAVGGGDGGGDEAAVGVAGDARRNERRRGRRRGGGGAAAGPPRPVIALPGHQLAGEVGELGDSLSLLLTLELLLWLAASSSISSVVAASMPRSAPDINDHTKKG